MVVLLRFGGAQIVMIRNLKKEYSGYLAVV